MKSDVGEVSVSVPVIHDGLTQWSLSFIEVWVKKLVMFWESVMETDVAEEWKKKGEVGPAILESLRWWS